MAFDGLTLSKLLSELNDALLGARVDKIYQPLSDEIILSLRGQVNHKLLLCANASHPRLYFTEITKENPKTAPLFCMVLRKHLSGGRILSISQPDFERIVVLEIESANEMGDMTTKQLILEIMGKHSNLILTDENGRILDAIKHVSHEKSSVREVLPGRTYVFPPTQNKRNPLTVAEDAFYECLYRQGGLRLTEALYQGFTGISPVLASEVCVRAGLDPSGYIEALSKENAQLFWSVLQEVLVQEPVASNIYYEANGRILDFSVIPMRQFSHLPQKGYDTISTLLEAFYHERAHAYHLKQQTHDTRRLLLSNLERCYKKREIQQKTKADTKNMEKWKRRGELINAYIYAIQEGATQFLALDFYEEEQPERMISLDPQKTPAENAQVYFQKYQKAKRTLAALEVQVEQNEEEIQYLESVLLALDTMQQGAELAEIRQELMDVGYLKRKPQKKKQAQTKPAKPLHYVSPDGWDIWVGKNNMQNDQLTLRFAEAGDLWLHTKEIPGSHVIVRTQGREVPDATLLAAANLAAYHSKGRESSSVPVDYALRKFVKKPAGAKPGMVIYTHNKTLYITPDEAAVPPLSE